MLGAASGSKSVENTSSAASEPEGQTLWQGQLPAWGRHGAWCQFTLNHQRPQWACAALSTRHKENQVLLAAIYCFSVASVSGVEGIGVEARTEEETGSQCFLLPSLLPLCGLKRMFL